MAVFSWQVDLLAWVQILPLDCVEQKQHQTQGDAGCVCLLAVAFQSTSNVELASGLVKQKAIGVRMDMQPTSEHLSLYAHDIPSWTLR